MGEGGNDDKQPRDGRPASRLSRFRLWLAGYYELEVIGDRDNDHLLRDVGLTREEARDALRPWWIIGLLLLPRRGRE